MAIFANDDITTMLDDWGHVLTFDSGEAPCTFENAEREVLDPQGGAPQIIQSLIALYRTSDFPTLADGDEVEIDGVTYTVWRALRLTDGGVTELWLRLT